MSEPSQDKKRSQVAPPKLLFESGSPGRSAIDWPAEGGKIEASIPVASAAPAISTAFPSSASLKCCAISPRLSQRNFSIESQFYPLGSCTMKYNPKINEVVARFPGFAQIHPLAAARTSARRAGVALRARSGCWPKISGMEHVSLQPSAGAQGELTGLMLIRAYLSEQGNPRKNIIVPDTAHGTNPASSTLCGYDVIQISSNDKGRNRRCGGGEGDG